MALIGVTPLLPANVVCTIHLLDHGGDPAVTGECIVTVVTVDEAGEATLPVEVDGKIATIQTVPLFDLINPAQEAHIINIMTKVRTEALKVLP